MLQQVHPFDGAPEFCPISCLSSASCGPRLAPRHCKREIALSVLAATRNGAAMNAPP
jgi:hypothetical protein